MPMNTQTTHPKDKKPALSVSEYLWLQGEKSRLESLDSQLTRMQYRLDMQADWIVFLLVVVALLSACLLISMIF